MKNKTNEESLNFIKSFEALLRNDEGFAEEYLSSKGYDSETMGIEFENVAQKTILQKRAKHEKDLLGIRMERAKLMLKRLNMSAETGLNKIQELLNPSLVKKYSLNFRELKQMKEEEALKILSNIEILEFLEKEYENDNTKDKS